VWCLGTAQGGQLHTARQRGGGVKKNGSTVKQVEVSPIFSDCTIASVYVQGDTNGMTLLCSVSELHNPKHYMT